MSRSTNTERIGVYEVGLKFTKELDWIFREQSIVDVGIDALVEQKFAGNPTGKFLALQIKTGEGNFHVTDQNLVYYASNIHYYYWLNSNLPVVLVAHLPETGLTIWEHICEENVQKTKKQWKINLSKKKKLCENSVAPLSKILEATVIDNFTRQLHEGYITDEIIDKISEKIDSINQASRIIKNITDLFLELGEKTQVMADKILEFANQGINDKDKLVVRTVKKYSQYLNNFTYKVNNELGDFAYNFSEGFQAYEKLTLVNYQINEDFEAIQNTHTILTHSLNEMKASINSTLEFKNEVLSLPKKYAHLKKSRLNLLETSNQILKELRVASNFLYNFLNNIEDKLS